MNIPEKVSLKCLSCDLVLDVDTEIADNIKSGDQVKCNHCGESNDFDSMVKAVEEEVVELAEKEIEKSLGKFFQ